MNNMRMYFLKNTWMVLWRLTLLFAVFGHGKSFLPLIISVLVGAITVFKLGKTSHIFPIVRWFAHKEVFYTIGTSPISVPSGKALKSTSKMGRITGWEPDKLGSKPVPTPSSYPRMHGTPGKGLAKSGFSEKSVSLGVLGEINFAKILADVGMLDKFDSYWSVAMPDDRGMFPDKKFTTDIDCILVSGNTIVLVDVKMYTGGDGTYRKIAGSKNNEFALFDNKTGAMVGSVRTPSHNMAMALDRFRKHFPQYNIQALVVFVPTQRGIADIPKKTISWHNNIYAYSVDDALKVLFAVRSSKNVNHKIESKMVPLLKG